ncbi:MAG: PAS domain-containing protein [Kofleriaceae bacterium]|nr:PAS domain-containing protein [Kofleriaceae bacterium]
MGAPGRDDGGTQDVRFLEGLERVGRALQGSDDVEQMLRDALDQALIVFGCDRIGLLYPCDPEAEVWSAPMERTVPAYPDAFGQGPLPASADLTGLLGLLRAAAGPLRFGPEGDFPLPAGARTRFGVQSQLAMMITPRTGRPYALIAQQCDHARVWSPADATLFAAIGRRLADALSTLLLLRDLRQNAARLDQAERVARVGYWDRDLVGQRATASATAAAILGAEPVAREDDLASWDTRWSAAVHPDDRAAADHASAVALRWGGHYHADHRVVGPGGEVRHVHVRGEVSVDAGGHPVRVFGTIQDVTDQVHAREAERRREERFRVLIENASDLITVVDGAGRVRFQSPSAERLLGYPAAVWADADLLAFVHPDDRPALAAALATAVAHPGAPVTAEFRIRRSDGRWRVAAAIGRSVPQPGDPRAFVVLNARDLTDSRQLEEQLRQAQKLEAIGQLAGGVAHDFNNILAAMMVQLELIAMTPGLPAQVTEDLELVRSSTIRAADLTRQLLMFGRRQLMQMRDVDLSAVVRDLARMLGRVLGEPIVLEVDTPATPLPVRCDPGMIDQLVLNLVVNARDAMPSGGRVRLATSTVLCEAARVAGHPGASPGWHACVTVADTGTGIAADVLPHVFEPFFTTKGVGQGTGLGLATVFGIVSQHRGWIEVATSPSGTTFAAYLPMAAPSHEPATPRLPQPSPNLRGDETILVVEDDDAVRRSMRRVLEFHGYQVIEAVDGIEAQAAWRQHRARIALVLTDLVMPGGIDGQHLASLLRQDQPALRVVFSSGYSEQLLESTEALRPGENFLAKPYAPAQLLGLIRRNLDS